MVTGNKKNIGITKGHSILAHSRSSALEVDFSDTIKNFLKSRVCEDFIISRFQILCHCLKCWTLYIQAIFSVSEKSLNCAGWGLYEYLPAGRQVGKIKPLKYYILSAPFEFSELE
ncbi:MAG: hypothetical protein A2X59_11195 [Nitrospirae bacterium GWC2_42_7]|nr:MAG: hypothetical protein A2X59_11195 [Nitrospirae bacterium GWC2_42_7]